MEIPFLVVQGILYTMIVYWCTGQSADAGEPSWGVCAGRARHCRLHSRLDHCNVCRGSVLEILILRLW